MPLIFGRIATRRPHPLAELFKACFSPPNEMPRGAFGTVPVGHHVPRRLKIKGTDLNRPSVEKGHGARPSYSVPRHVTHAPRAVSISTRAPPGVITPLVVTLTVKFPTRRRRKLFRIFFFYKENTRNNYPTTIIIINTFILK